MVEGSLLLVAVAENSSWTWKLVARDGFAQGLAPLYDSAENR